MLNKKEIPVLTAEIKDELAKLEKLVERLAKRQARADDEEFSDSAALRLHNFYTGCEHIFRLIAKKIDGVLSQESDWHKRLLNQIALEIPGIRPAVITSETKKELENLLYFRHIVNLGTCEFKIERIEELIKLTLALFPQFVKDIDIFITFLLSDFNQA